MIRICLDAGHYGKYNRSPAVPAYYESDMVWKLHLLQKKFLEEYEGVSVITTRTDQVTDKALYDRGAASKGCDLFISDHSNAVGSGVNNTVDYVAVYHLVNDVTTEADDISKRIAEMLAPVISDVMGVSQGFRLVTRKSANDRNGDGMLNDNYYGVLHGARMVNTPGMILEHSFHTNTKVTKWLLNDDNLSRLAKAEADALAAYYGLVKKGQTAAPETNTGKVDQSGDNAAVIWNFLKKKGLNDFAVAGIMGNMKAESNLSPNNLQNSYEKKYGFTDAEYTAAVNTGAYGNFVHDSAGYGLVQWTYWSRKAALLEYAKGKGVSIGDLNMQLEFFWKEVQGYKSVMNTLENATSIREVSDAILHEYEKPADQSVAAEEKRASYGQEFFDKFAEPSGKSTPYKVRVKIDDLYIRKGAGVNYQKDGFTGKGVFTIVEEADGQISSTGKIGKWGLLKSRQKERNGWICLSLGASVTEKI